MRLIVDYSMDLDGAKYLKQGWSVPEAQFVWSCEEVSELHIPQLGLPGTYSFIFEFRPFAPAESPHRLIQVVANETTVLQFALSETREVTFSLQHDPDVHADGVTFRFRHLNPRRPSEFSSHTNDSRLLSIALLRFEVCLVEQTADRQIPGLTEQHNLLYFDATRREEFGARTFAELARDRDAFTGERGDSTATRTHIVRFLQGAAAGAFHIRRHFAHYIANRVSQDSAGTDNVFQFGSFLKADAVRRFAQRYSDLVFALAPESSAEQEEILAPSKHLGASRLLPPPINQVLHRQLRPAVNLYCIREANLYAAAYGHQMYDHAGKNARIEASALGLSKGIMLSPWRRVDGNIVIVQDRFSGSNFAHFLFDFMSRLKHFCVAKPELIERSTFVLGGVPTVFHEIIIGAFQRLYKVERHRLVFPGEGVNLRATDKIYWFSDSTEDQMLHPAQMMHPESVALFRDLGREIDCVNGAWKRIYISRGDVGTRALTNEGDVMAMLERYGFKTVRLADLPVHEQLGVVRGADVIVAPHGMGLTYLALHRGAPLVVELFNPTLASDDYACLATALGCPYDFVIGTETDPGSRGFAVDVESVEGVLRTRGVRPVT